MYTNQSNIKREHTSSQSDEDEKRERRRRKKSRWGDTPDVKPGTVATLPNVMPGIKYFFLVFSLLFKF